MATTKNTGAAKTAAPKEVGAAERKSTGGEKRAPGKKKTVVQKIRENVEKKLSKRVERASLADYIRLVQLEKVMDEMEPKETKATWVDPEKPEETTKSDSEK